MSGLSLHGAIRNGQVVFDVPIDWPDGTEVRVSPCGIDDDLPMSPAEIERVLAAMRRPKEWHVPEQVEAEVAAWEKACERHGTRELNVFPADAGSR